MVTTEQETDRLDAALRGQRARGVLSGDQVAAVREAYLSAPAPAPAASGSGGTDRRPLRVNFVEGALYLGAVLVAASLAVIAAQNWSELTRLQHVALLLVLSGATAAAAVVVVRVTPGRGPAVRREDGRAERRRVVSALLTASSVLFAGSVAAAMGDGELTALVASVSALVLLVGAHRVAPTVITDVALLGATLAVVGATVTQMDQGAVESDAGSGGQQPTRLFDYVLPTAFAATGLLWALVVAPRLTAPRIGVVLGLVVAFETAAPAAANESTRGWGLGLLAALAVVGIVMVVRDGFWAWLVLSLLSVTAFVFVLVGQRAGASVAFLVAGLVLLGGAAFAARRGRPSET